MRLRTATLLAIAAFTYIFIIKTIGTVFPFIALVSIYVKITETLSLIASFALVYFYVIFYKDYVQKEQAKLRIATSFAIIIIVLSMFMEVIRLMRVYDVTFIPATSGIRHTEVIVPLAGAFIMLFFFVSFYNENLFENQMKLKKATSLAIVGASAFVLLYISVVVNYFYFVETRQPLGIFSNSEVSYIIGSAIIIFYFAVNLYFFTAFYKVREQN